MKKEKLISYKAMDGKIYSIPEDEFKLLEEIENDLENGNYKSISEEEKKKTIQAFNESVTKREKREPITIRVRKNDLSKLKDIAKNDGIPYQTLINSLIKNFVDKNKKSLLDFN